MGRREEGRKRIIARERGRRGEGAEEAGRILTRRECEEDKKAWHSRQVLWETQTGVRAGEMREADGQTNEDRYMQIVTNIDADGERGRQADRRHTEAKYESRQTKRQI